MNFERDDTSVQFMILKVLAIPSLVVLAVVVPLFLFFKLRRNRHKLTNINVIMSYGLLFRE